MTWVLHNGDCLEVLRGLPDASAQTCVTSPPYWNLRDYGVEGQLGLEATPEEYVANMVRVFREVWRVLRDDGTLWLNLGDCYAKGKPRTGEALFKGGYRNSNIQSVVRAPCLKPKNIVGIPWKVAFALQADGWYLRTEIIWHKPNPMTESVTDRPTRAHEYIFLFSKSKQYHYDHEAIKEPAGENMLAPAGSSGTLGPEQSRRRKSGNKERKINAPCRLNTHMGSSIPWEGNKRNKRSVWTVATIALKEAHFATFPPKLIEPCILAGCPQGGTVLDPFAGAGTTLLVSENLGRNSIGIELNPDYCEIIRRRMANRQTTLFEMGADT